MAQLDVWLTGDRRLQDRPPLGWQHSFIEIGYEIFSMVILSHLLVQEGVVSFCQKNVHNTG